MARSRARDAVSAQLARLSMSAPARSPAAVEEAVTPAGFSCGSNTPASESSLSATSKAAKNPGWISLGQLAPARSPIRAPRCLVATKRSGLAVQRRHRSRTQDGRSTFLHRGALQAIRALPRPTCGDRRRYPVRLISAADARPACGRYGLPYPSGDDQGRPVRPARPALEQTVRIQLGDGVDLRL